MSIRRILKDKQVWFHYEGYITEDILSGTTNALKLRLSCDDIDMNVAKSGFYIFVELVQNIIRYSAYGETITSVWGAEDLKFGTFVIGRGPDNIMISSENLIETTNTKPLDDHLAHLKGLSADDLKQLYKDILRKAPHPDSKGAGVGFIEIARKATLGFEYSFTEIDENFSKFIYTAYVGT
jgi:hypothetical protein